MRPPWQDLLTGVPWRLRRRLDAVTRRFQGDARKGSREDHREVRHALLARSRDLSASVGLEIGAGDLATVRAHEGDCSFADFRSSTELSDRLGFQGDAMEPLTYVIDRDKPLHHQIPRQFDYIVLCHVLEHVPDPIGYLEDLVDMLLPGGQILIALPDKRQTPDFVRESTRLEALLDAYHRRVSKPSLSQVLESERAWKADIAALARRDPRAYYAAGIEQISSPEVDAHCHVWTDAEFLTQLEWLIRGGFLGPVLIQHLEPTRSPLNEFHVLLCRDESLAMNPEGKLIRAPRALEWGTHIFLVEQGRKRWITSPGVRAAVGMEDARIWFLSERVFDEIPFGAPLELVDESEADAAAPRWKGEPPSGSLTDRAGTESKGAAAR